MKERIRPALPLAALAGFVGFALTALPAQAVIVFATVMSGPNAPSTTTDEVTYSADVSSSDLLHGITGTGGLWNGNGATPGGLNDGLAGGDFDASGLTALVGKTWARDGDTLSFRVFELGVGAGLGFDITEIQSIASWQGAGFPNQKYDVSVRFVGDAAFTALTLVEYQPFPALPSVNGGSTKVNVTDTTGVLASGVEAIRFDIRDTVSNNAGGTVFAEIDVFGAATAIPEPTASALLGLGGLALLRRRRGR